MSISLGAGTPSGLEQWLCVLTSLCEFICAAILCLEGLVLLDSSIPSASYSFSSSSSTGFPKVWGEGLAGDIPSMIYKWALCFQILEKVWRTMNFMTNDNYIKFMFPCSWAMLDHNSTQCIASVSVANDGSCVLRNEWNNHGRDYNCWVSTLDYAASTGNTKGIPLCAVPFLSFFFCSFSLMKVDWLEYNIWGSSQENRWLIRVAGLFERCLTVPWDRFEGQGLSFHWLY